MRIVSSPRVRPQRCAAIPFIGAHHPEARWVDTGSELPGFDNHVYLSDIAVREAGRLLGFPDASEYRELKDALERAEREVSRLEDEVERLSVLVEAKRTLEAAGLEVSSG